MEKKTTAETLAVLSDLIQRKRIIVETLERLGKNLGTYKDDKEHERSACTEVQFKLYYGASTHSWDTALNMKLVRTAFDHLQQELQSIDLLLGLAEEAVKRSIGAELDKLKQ